jgi:hypothetical protein
MFLMLALLAATAPALAEDGPLIRPLRDVAVEYRQGGMAQGQAAEPGRVLTMRFASKTGRIRIDGPIAHGYAIVDIDAAQMTMVMAEQHMYVEQPADPAMLAIFQAKNASFRKTGSDTVAGVACTTYEANLSDRKGQVCLTGDGVLLRAKSADPDRNRALEAVAVTYADQPASLFEIPPGFQKLDMATIQHGMTSGQPSGSAPGGQLGR